MSDEFLVTCSFCGEQLEIYVEFLRFLLSLQYCIHLAKRKSTHKWVSLLSRTEFRYRTHFLRKPGQLASEWHFPSMHVRDSQFMFKTLDACSIALAE